MNPSDVPVATPSPWVLHSYVCNHCIATQPHKIGMHAFWWPWLWPHRGMYGVLRQSPPLKGSLLARMLQRWQENTSMR